MKLISKKINFDQISIFTIISFFLLTISFLISKSFIENEEISDYIFTLSTIILFELSFLILLNNLQKFKIKSRGDFFLYTIVFILIFLLWNYSISNNFIDFTSFILFHILIISFVILSEYNSKEIKNISLSTVFTYLLFSFLLSGIFYQFENNSNSELLEIILITFSYYLILKLIKKDSSLIQSVLSVVVFIVLLKVFLLSAEKDSFHYSWWLGPINSSIVGNELLTDTVSQYGYLSILIVDKFSNLTNFETDKSFLILITIFFIIFFYIFVREALSNIRYPFFLIVLFSSLLIFGNIGSSNLSGAMLIPSSSVYRFLPSLLTIYFLSKIIINHKKNYHINLASFFSLLLISTIWSFESLFFISFCLISTFSLGLLYLFFDKKKYKKNNKFEFYNKNKYYFFSYLGFYIIFLFLITWNKDLVFFYEHALNLKTAALSKEIINSRNTLLFLTFLFVNFILLRASFNPLKIRIFFYNLLWFSLFISFTSYFIVRSHSNNVFSLLPFFIFFILMLKTNSLIIKEYKTIFIKIFIFFVIVSSATSSYLNREIFLNKLMLKTFLKAPLYDYEQYIPSNKIQIRLNENKNIPVTLISGSTIHSLNKTLNYGGYGLPILPLEQFNRLSFNRKDFLMNKYFKKNNKHYVLCLIDCEFYTRNIKMTNWSNIYLSANVNAVVVSSSKNIDFSETLYLLNLKN
jgi:hypothetical protein